MKWNKSLDYSANRTRRVLHSNVLDNKSYQNKADNKTYSNRVVHENRKSELYLNLVDKIDTLSKTNQKDQLNQLRDIRKKKKVSRHYESEKEGLQVFEKMDNNISNISHRDEREKLNKPQETRDDQEGNKFDVFDVKFEPLNNEQPKHLDKYIINNEEKEDEERKVSHNNYSMPSNHIVLQDYMDESEQVQESKPPKKSIIEKFQSSNDDPIKTESDADMIESPKEEKRETVNENKGNGVSDGNIMKKRKNPSDREYEVQRANNFIKTKPKTIGMSRTAVIIKQNKVKKQTLQISSKPLFNNQKRVVDDGELQNKVLKAESEADNFRFELEQKEVEIQKMKELLAQADNSVANIKEQLKSSRLNASNALTNYRNSKNRAEELSFQLDSMRDKLQISSERFGKIVDYIYRLNSAEHLEVLEGIIGQTELTNLNDIYKKYENLNKKQSDLMTLVYMTNDQDLIDKLEEIEKSYEHH